MDCVDVSQRIPPEQQAWLDKLRTESLILDTSVIIRGSMDSGADISSVNYKVLEGLKWGPALQRPT